MRELLEKDFPAVRQFIGQEKFGRLAEDFLRMFPAKPRTTEHQAEHFPNFLQSDESLRHRGFLQDLARLELAVSKAGRAAITPTLTAERVASIPGHAWDNARLDLVPSLQLLAFRYAANDYFQSVGEGRPHPRTTRQDSWLAIFRRPAEVSRLELSRRGYHLLLDLRDGKTLGEGLASLARKFRCGVVEQELFEWFRDWTADGVFSSVEVP